MVDLLPVSTQATPADNYSRINAAITAVNALRQAASAAAQALVLLRDQQQSTTTNVSALQGDVSDLQGDVPALQGHVSALQGDVSALQGDLGNPAWLPVLYAARLDPLRDLGRPGDRPGGFTLVQSTGALAGDGSALPDAPPAAAGDYGLAARLVGPGVLAQRVPQPVEVGRVYRVRYAVQRRANPSDPNNDTVRLGVCWYDAGNSALAPSSDATKVSDLANLTTALGRQELTALFSLSPCPSAQFTAPPRARYARAYVQAYGLDGVTDVEVLSLDDVSDTSVLAPETADTVQRVGALESQNAGQRLNALEANANAPNSVTFPTKSDAASGGIPNTVTSVELRGAVQVGDGGQGLYARVAGAAPAGSDSFVNNGASFVRVYQSSETLGALLLSLPASEPSVAGQAWLDGRTLVVS